MAKDKKAKFSSVVSVKNRKARYEFEFIDKLEVGIVLAGSEIKSIREGKVQITEAFCIFHKSKSGYDRYEMFVQGLYISPYQDAAHYGHEPRALRKLLLHKKQIDRWKQKAEEKGLTIIVSALYTNDQNRIKLEIVLAKGKKLFDKRKDMKSKEMSKEIRVADF